ncbi:hypothetical protein [Pseudomonas putida]|uniref:hypothetical protein n=1 Tax=Pseudomonas putida TaxID=303 RepID=UPI0039059CC3
MSNKKTIAASSAPAGVTFRDKTHTSRSLFMPGGRELKVVSGSLVVQVGDDEALAYLERRRDFEQLDQAV